MMVAYHVQKERTVLPRMEAMMSGPRPKRRTKSKRWVNISWLSFLLLE
jgi:hypothetical protein